MPTPERVKAASREKRRRVCVICGANFMVPSADRVGRTCSKECGREYMSRVKTGTRAAPETRAKMSASQRRRWGVEGYADRIRLSHAEAVAKWHADPENAAAFSRMSSERMKRLHQDPDFQKRRDERSSQTMKENWRKHRDRYVAAAVDRYLRGEGINSEESKQRKAEANKWIMKRANAALHTETDIDAKMSELNIRLRREMPYDGPAEGSDYAEYCQKLCRATAAHPEYREIADPFMAAAIPRFAAEWAACRNAIAMEARRGETGNTDSTAEGGDSAGPQDIAQESIPSSDMGKGE